MDYKINVDVLRWKQGQVVSELELLSEGVDISKWLKDNLLVIPEVESDLNKDGVIDDKDVKASTTITSKIKAVIAKNKKTGGKR
jgi:hypothetical protein